MSSVDLKTRLEATLVGGMISGAIALGKQLGLFDALAAVSSAEDPADAGRVAERAGCKERYVREWLCAMGCAEYIQMDRNERFWMTEEQIHEFTGLNNINVAFMRNVPIVLKPFNELADAFKRGGLAYSEFADFYAMMDEVTRAMHGKHLIPSYLPLIGMADKLAAGGLRVLDVGCGLGFHSIALAKEYPKCQFIGVDLSEKAIGMAKEAQKKANVDNLEFLVMDAGAMAEEWTASFDLITIFDACHDQMRPDKCVREIHRLLKPDGLFAMLEVRGCSNAWEDKQLAPSFIAAMYAISMFHCLPVASNSPDALCMGALWGEKRATKLISEAGFDNIQTVNPPFFPKNVVYLCRK